MLCATRSSSPHLPILICLSTLQSGYGNYQGGGGYNGGGYGGGGGGGYGGDGYGRGGYGRGGYGGGRKRNRGASPLWLLVLKPFR